MRICKLGEDILRAKCTAVRPEEINDGLRRTLAEMFETMTGADGVGLAAPQVGIAERFFVVIADDNVRRVFINPEIIGTSEELCEFEEGCLSLPGYPETITRPERVSVSALDEYGRRFVLNDASGLLARIIQHENDHLDGVLYIDRGDEKFKEETVEAFRKKAERAERRREQKEAKRLSIKAKIAARSRGAGGA